MARSCFDLLDRHVVGGRADAPALAAGATRWTYARLLEEVASFGGVLRHCGVREGDRVVLALPESVEALVAVLATARVGATHRLVDAETLATALADGPVRVLATDSAQSYASAALDGGAPVPDVVLVKQRPDTDWALREGRDYDWDVVIRAGRTDPAACLEGSTLEPDDDLVREWVEQLVAGRTVRIGS